MDPVIAEILRAKTFETVRSDVFRRWQNYLRDVVQPQLDELDALKAPVPAQPESMKKGRAS